MKNTIRFFLYLIIIFFSSGKSFAQVEKFYSTEKDISNSLINEIYQDKKGFVWIEPMRRLVALARSRRQL